MFAGPLHHPLPCRAASILVVDDHPIFAEGFVLMMRRRRPGWRLTIARSAAEAIERIDGLPLDLLMVDAGLPDEDGIALVRRVADHTASLPQVVMSGRTDMAMRMRARGCGARGFIPKTIEPDAMISAIEIVLDGKSYFDAPTEPALPTLTFRQSEVLELLVQGHGNKEIRHRLGIAERTVRAHLTELFQQLGVGSRMQAVIRARELGLAG